jgi:hypothetical protein
LLSFDALSINLNKLFNNFNLNHTKKTGEGNWVFDAKRLVILKSTRPTKVVTYQLNFLIKKVNVSLLVRTFRDQNRLEFLLNTQFFVNVYTLKCYFCVYCEVSPFEVDLTDAYTKIYHF